MIARLHQLAPWFDVPDFAFGFLCGAVLVMVLWVWRIDRERDYGRIEPLEPWPGPPPPPKHAPRHIRRVR